MNENSLDQVEVLTIDDERYVIGTSLAKVIGISPNSYEGWIRRQIKKLELVYKTNSHSEQMVTSTMLPAD